MNKAAKRSSRKLMASRNRRKSKQTPGAYSAVNEKQETVQMSNRARRRQMLGWAKATQGLSAKIEARTKRKKLLVAARRALRAIRKETRRLMKLRAVGQ